MSDATKKQPSNGRGGKPPAKRRAGVTSEILDRQPPVSIEAEHGVIGSMLIDPECCDEVLLQVGTADFYDDMNATVFSTLEEMWNGSKAIDVTTLVEQLTRRFAADARDDPKRDAQVHVARIANAVANAAHAVYYAKIVREKSVLRTLINSAQEILRDAYGESGSSETIAATAEQKIFSIQDRGTTETPPVNDILHAAIEAIDSRKKGGAVCGVQTGFYSLDKMLGGMRPGELIIVAARPSMGKSALAMNIAENVVLEQGKSCLFISLEMSALNLVDRMLSGISRVPSNRMREGTIDARDQQKIVDAADKIFNRPLWIDDNAGLRVSQIASKARRIKRKTGLDLLVIDYLQFIQPDDPGIHREQQVAVISRGLKNLAKNLDIPVLVVAQLNRQTEQGDRRPKLSNLRESGSLEQDADVVMFVHREEYYLSEEQREKLKADGDKDIIGKADIIIAKQRNGPVGDVKLLWFKEFTRFENPAPDNYTEEFETFNYGPWA